MSHSAALPAWANEPLIACLDGPLIHQWFTATDWSARIDSARYMAGRGQRRPCELDYHDAGTATHPRYRTVTGRALHHDPDPGDTAPPPEIDCTGEEPDMPTPTTQHHQPEPQPEAGTPGGILAAALAHAARGWHVFPLAPGAKRPAVKAWEERATTDPTRIERCWSSTPTGGGGPYGIGIACGPSGLVVIDLDQPKPGTGPAPAPFDVPGIHDGADVFAAVCQAAGMPVPWDTYTVSTGRGGTHLYYTAPDVREPTTGVMRAGISLRNTAGTLGWLIDTRAHGGYVVAAPTVVEGRPYVLDQDAPVADLPHWLAETLTPAPMPAQQPVSVPLTGRSGRSGGERRDAYLNAAIGRQLASILTATEGGRNHALYLSAVALGQLVAGGELDAFAVGNVLEVTATGAGLTRTETNRTIASGLRAGAKRPRTLTAVPAGVAA